MCKCDTRFGGVASVCSAARTWRRASQSSRDHGSKIEPADRTPSAQSVAVTGTAGAAAAAAAAAACGRRYVLAAA